MVVKPAGPMQGVKKRQPQTPEMLGAFMPGQRGLLANQLNKGFGGGMGAWKGLLSDSFSPMTAPQPFQYGQGGGMGGKNPGEIGTGQQDLLQPYVTAGSQVSVYNNPALRDGYASLNDNQKKWLESQWAKSPTGFGSPFGNMGGR